MVPDLAAFPLPLLLERSRRIRIDGVLQALLLVLLHERVQDNSRVQQTHKRLDTA